MPALSIPMVFAIVAAAGVFLVVLGLNQARRSAGGSEDFQARLAAYGVTTTAGCGRKRWVWNVRRRSSMGS